MSLDKVKKYFERLGVDENRIKEFEATSKTENKAAEVLGLDKARVTQTICLMKEGEPIIIVTSGDAKIDNSAYKHKFNTKIKPLNYNEITKLIGHEIGGECPFGLINNVKVFLDESLKRFDSVYIACGSNNSIIEMSIDELEQYCSNFSGWIDLCKNWKK